MTATDSDLIARVLARDDRAAFEELVHRHQSSVRGFLRQLAHGDASLADDLAQDTFVHAYRNLDRFRGRAKFSTWLLGIAHNMYRNARRHSRLGAKIVESLESESAAPAGTRTSDLREDLAAAIRQLSPDEQLALELGYRQGLSHVEIAELVDWPLGTVKTHLARSKEKLRHLLHAWNPQA